MWQQASRIAYKQACVSEGTDYLDITGEPEFIERMQLNYHAQAEAKVHNTTITRNHDLNVHCSIIVVLT